MFYYNNIYTETLLAHNETISATMKLTKSKSFVVII